MVPNDIEILITRYLDNSAVDEELSRLRQWIDSDKDNMEEFMLRKSLWDAAHIPFDPDGINVPVALGNVMDRMDMSSHSATPARRVWTWWSRIAAIMILPLIGISLYYMTGNKDTEESFQVLHSNYGSTIEAQLPDGSRVWLNANSSLSYSNDYSSDRIVNLEGEAYFEVKSSIEHPFLVRTSDMTVKATGTAFNVNAYNTDNITTVTLVEGRVSISTPADTTVTLEAGNRLVYNINDDRLSISTTDTYNSIAWKDGLLIFRETPLAEVFDRLEQIYNVDFTLTDTVIGSIQYRATFDGENLNEILNLLELSAPIDCITDDTEQTKTGKKHIVIAPRQKDHQ